jgi:hypothetical protein
MQKAGLVRKDLQEKCLSNQTFDRSPRAEAKEQAQKKSCRRLVSTLETTPIAYRLLNDAMLATPIMTIR